MGKIYQRKTDRQSWSKDNMKRALTEIKNQGSSVNAASKAYQIPEATLRRYVKKYSDENFPEKAGRFKSAFSGEQLNQLKKYVLDIDKRAFGLTKDQFRKIAFDFAVHCGVADRFNTTKRMVGKDFAEDFMRKFNISLRKPEATSAARLMAFNKVNVEAFFKVYKELHRKYSFSASQIYNIDETGFSTVPTKDPKVLTPRGNRRVVKISSAERGVNVTAVCGMNAIGNFIPPFLIFPRVKMQPALKNGAPVGTTAVAHPSGWMTSESFLKYLEHFKENARPSENNPVLLLMDNHTSHVSLDAIELCRKNHIILLGFPPHTSHRMQPLDVSIYGPLKTAYSRTCEDFLTSNPGRLITLYDVSTLFGKAYLKAATVSNALSGFRATGLYPIDSQVFDYLDFEASLITERDQPISTDVPTASAFEEVELEEIPGSETHNSGLKDTRGEESAQPIPTTPGPSTSNIAAHTTPPHESDCLLDNGLPALPVAEVKSKRTRKKLPSLIISSTPVLKVLEEKEANKIEKERRRKLRDQKKNERLEKSRKAQKVKQKPVRRKIKFNDSSDSSIDLQYADSDNDADDERDCIICNERGKDEIWFCCSKCKEWAHAECTGMDTKEAKMKKWSCDWCL